MNKLLTILCVLMTVMTLAGCGNSSSSDKDWMTMEIGTEYPISTGDRIEPDGNEFPIIRVRHVADGDLKYVTLLSGAALLYSK